MGDPESVIVVGDRFLVSTTTPLPLALKGELLSGLHFIDVIVCEKHGFVPVLQWVQRNQWGLRQIQEHGQEPEASDQLLAASFS